MKALGLLELEYDIVLSLAHHVHTFTYGKNWVKIKVSGGHSPDPTPKMAVLGPKMSKNGLIYYYRYLKKWFYEKVYLAKVPLKNFFC